MIWLGPTPIMLQAELGEVVRLRNEGHSIVSPFGAAVVLQHGDTILCPRVGQS